MPIFVKTVFEKGAAAEQGGLKRGDQILTVNSISLEAREKVQAELVAARVGQKEAEVENAGLKLALAKLQAAYADAIRSKNR